MRSTRTLQASMAVLMIAGALAAGWAGMARGQSYDSRDRDWGRYHARGWHSRSGMLRANTPIEVRIDSRISTEYAREGDSWTGRISRTVTSGDGVVIPAGAPVEGVVTQTKQGGHDTQAELDLAVTGVSVNGDRLRVNADADPIVAGSHRAKQLGAIAGGAAVGALVGHQVSHKHGGLFGGLLGGIIGYGATRHAFRTLELEPGTEITFTTSEDLYARR